MTTKLTCDFCGKDTALTKDNEFRVHGPRADRCEGSGTTPATFPNDFQSTMDQSAEQIKITALGDSPTILGTLAEVAEEARTTLLRRADTLGYGDGLRAAMAGEPSPTSHIAKTKQQGIQDAMARIIDAIDGGTKVPEPVIPVTIADKTEGFVVPTGIETGNGVQPETWPHLYPPTDPRHLHDIDAGGNCRNLQCPYNLDTAYVEQVLLDCEPGPVLAPPTPDITAARLETDAARKVAAEQALAERSRPAAPAWTGEQRLESLDAVAVLGKVEAIREVMNLLRVSDGRLSCDIETEGLGLAARRIKCVIFSGVPRGDRATILDPRDPDQAKVVTWVFDQATELVFHKSAYDVPQLAVNGLFTREHCAKVTDTLLYARGAEPGNDVSKALGSCCERYLHLAYDKKGMLKAGKTVGMGSSETVYREMDLDRPIYARGAAVDAVVTARLLPLVRKAYLDRLTVGHPYGDWGVQGSEAEDLVEREQILNRMSLRRTVKGLRVDLDYLDEFNASHAQRIEAEERKLRAAGIRPTNAQDLLKVLDEQNLIPEGYPITPKAGKWSGDKNHLPMLGSELAQDFIWHKEQVHILRDYLEKVRDYAVKRDGDMWVHPVVNYFGATTGRQSIEEPPFHQFPGPARGVVEADPGSSLTSIDWSQIEPVLIANTSGQLDVLELYENHGLKFYTAISDLTGIPYKQAKAQLLGTLYGQGLELTAAKLGVSLEEARRIKDAVFVPLPLVYQMTQTLRQLGKDYRLIPTISGRMIPIPMGQYKGEWSVATHKAVNYHVQGSAYDVLADAGVQIEKAGLGDAVYLFMHDETICDSEAAHDIRTIMETPSQRLCDRAGRVPVLRTDMVELGQRWSTA